MNTPYSLWHIDGERPMKRRPQLEIIGKTFILVDSEWRSEPYYFGDLVYKVWAGRRSGRTPQMAAGDKGRCPAGA